MVYENDLMHAGAHFDRSVYILTLQLISLRGWLVFRDTCLRVNFRSIVLARVRFNRIAERYVLGRETLGKYASRDEQQPSNPDGCQVDSQFASYAASTGYVEGQIKSHAKQ